MIIYIPIHSIVDLITNSSSELFVTSTNDTPAAATALINDFLKLSGSNKTSTDLFNIKTVYGIKGEYTDYSWKYFDSTNDLNTWREENDIEEYDEYYATAQFLSVESKNDDDMAARKIAESFAKFINSLDAAEHST